MLFSNKSLAFALFVVASAGATREPKSEEKASSSRELQTSGGLQPSCNALDGSGFDICLDLRSVTGDTAWMSDMPVAQDKWESVITGHVGFYYTSGLPQFYPYQCTAFPNILDDVYVCASDANIDGVGGVLGRASQIFYNTGNGLAVTGFMEFDIDDINNLRSLGIFTTVVKHELGHILGVAGNTWRRNGVVQNGSYVGAQGIAEWNALNCTGSPPIETSGGAGTAGSHWDEQVLGNELMTGYLSCANDADCPLSKVTVGSLDDMGYQVDYTAADPYDSPCARRRRLRGDGDVRLLKNGQGNGNNGNGNGGNGSNGNGNNGNGNNGGRKPELSSAGRGKAVAYGKQQLKEMKVNKPKGKLPEGIGYSGDAAMDILYMEGDNIYAVHVEAEE